MIGTFQKRPPWLDKKINLSDCQPVRKLLGDLNLNTVCRQALCPNMGECFGRGEATFLILGKVCTRGCGFCGIEKDGMPEPLDITEAKRVAEAVNRLGLSHVVITSVTRDDLADGGAGVFIETILQIRKLNKGISIEVLIPDFQLNKQAIKGLVETMPDIIAHNVETVPRLYGYARKGANYKRSLEVLKTIKYFNKDMPTKSGIMLGLGESEEEILDVFEDLIWAGCDFLSIGQYLSPGRSHVRVKEYIKPERFEYYKQKAIEAGFSHVESAPYVRSSYRAKGYLERGII